MKKDHFIKKTIQAIIRAAKAGDGELHPIASRPSSLSR